MIKAILLKNLRSSFESLRTNGEAVEIMGDFSVHAERVEAFLGFFSIIKSHSYPEQIQEIKAKSIQMKVPTVLGRDRAATE